MSNTFASNERQNSVIATINERLSEGLLVEDDIFGESVICRAFHHDMPEVALHLIEVGASLTAKDIDGEMALSTAFRYANREVLTIVIEALKRKPIPQHLVNNAFASLCLNLAQSGRKADLTLIPYAVKELSIDVNASVLDNRPLVFHLLESYNYPVLALLFALGLHFDVRDEDNSSVDEALSHCLAVMPMRKHDEFLEIVKVIENADRWRSAGNLYFSLLYRDWKQSFFTLQDFVPGLETGYLVEYPLGRTGYISKEDFDPAKVIKKLRSAVKLEDGTLQVITADDLLVAGDEPGTTKILITTDSDTGYLVEDAAGQEFYLTREEYRASDWILHYTYAHKGEGGSAKPLKPGYKIATEVSTGAQSIAHPSELTSFILVQ